MTKVQTRFKENGPRHFIRQWRKFRGYTQERLAERIGVTHGNLSQLEQGKINYTQPMLEALSDALSCNPADLLIRNPLVDGAVWSLEDQLRKAPPEKKEEVVRVVEVMLKKAS